MKKYIRFALGLLSILGVVGCSVTKNMPEDELFYVGMRRTSFNELAEKTLPQGGQNSGVITDLANAYHTVDGLVRGNYALTTEILSDKKAVRMLTPAQRDSLERIKRSADEAMSLAKAEVEGALAYAPNNSFMGSTSMRHPFPLGLWIHNRYAQSQSRFGKWMYNTFASTPIYISTVNPEVRARVAQNTLRNYGYFRGKVDYEVIPQRNPRKAKVGYTVQTGELFRLETISYLPFAKQADSLVQSTRWMSKLTYGKPFSVVDLDAERTRISTLLRNNGFYYYKPEYVTFRADTVQHPLNVQLQVTQIANVPDVAKRRYHLGKTLVSLYKYDDYKLTDTVARRDFEFRYVAHKGKAPLRFGSLRRHIQYKKGETYCHDEHGDIADELGSMGIFSQVSVKYTPADTTATCDTLNLEVQAVLDKPYDAEFETKVTSKSNGQVGPGVSFGMSKRNAFRGAETLKLEAHGSYEWQTGSNIQGKSSVVNSYEYGTSLSLDYPRLIIPAWGRKWSRRAQATTSFAMDANWLNRAGYFGMVSLGAKVGYTYQRRATVKHEFIPFRLDYDELIRTTADFDSVMKNNQALYVSMRDQFVPSMQYTFTYTSRPTARNPRSFTIEVKESGNVTSAVFAAFGRSFSERDKKLFGVPFAQYLKVTAEFRDAFKLAARSYLATRIALGAVYSYGNSTTAPYNDLFSVGGANSVRGFAIRGVGPGSYHPAHSNYSYIDQMGDLKFEANVEYRFPVVGSLFGAVFLDAGNVWLMKSDPNRPGASFNLRRFGRDLALGTGAGLRYDLSFLVLRFDVGVGLHAPYDTGKKGYYNMPKFLDSLGYHFAIGYPF